ncbi:MAG TPA: PAS domain-containing sensor histidine kinase, partial [Burkholderiales bacterium]|nr:PAS domain-containing sensor histidine kinase [Burkholderiales bacterium]
LFTVILRDITRRKQTEADAERMQRTIDATQARLAAIVDSAMDAIISVDVAQNIVLFNRAAELIFGCPRGQAIGTPLERFIPERFRAAHRAHVEHFGRTGVTSRRMGDITTLWGLRADGEEFPLEASISQAGEPGAHYYTVILRDITLRKRAEAEAERARDALGEAQRRLGAIVDSAMDAVITVDYEQRIVLFNRAAEQVFGARREEMLGAPLDRLIPVRYRIAHHGHVEAFGRTGVTSRRMGDVTTLWALRPHSGEEFPIEASISQTSEEGRRFYTVILRDITRRKQAEDALKASERELRALSARVLEAREEEKARIARELHDELGQLLTAMKMDLGWLRERLPADADLAARAAEMGSLLDRTVSSTRRISADLRPLMLDDLGLADAAAWLIDDFCKRYNVACRADLAEAEALQQVSKSVATAVYRAIQEALTNIARHAHAANAWVMLTVEDGAIQLEIEDDGRGIAPDDLAKARSFGLKGMRERIAFLGGSVDIARAPRGGTRVRMRVPLRGLAEEAAA